MRRQRPTRDVDLLGFGDAVTPGPVDATYPVYTVVAEKLHAMPLGEVVSALRAKLQPALVQAVSPAAERN